MSKARQLGIKELKALVGEAPAVPLTADASNEEIKARIREKAIEALNMRGKLSREQWQIVSSLWDRLEPKNKQLEEEKMSASDARKIAEIWEKMRTYSKARTALRVGGERNDINFYR